jgi:hypothetical protein
MVKDDAANQSKLLVFFYKYDFICRFSGCDQ